jgi:predicted RNase H-like HicB family nuclease/predicted RNA binding protein YcfA (HicA-like mRNA interferase family)
MLQAYIKGALGRARYEILEDDGSYYGEIPDFQGVFANAETLEKCREELEEVLEEWVLFRVSRNLPLPTVDGMELQVRKVGWVPAFGPINRRDLVSTFRKLGFDGPYSGGKHEFMVRNDVTVRIPNPHRGDISVALLARILRQAGISRDEWEQVWGFAPPLEE